MKSRLVIENLDLSDKVIQATREKVSINASDGMPEFIEEQVTPTVDVNVTSEVEFDTHVKWAINKKLTPLFECSEIRFYGTIEGAHAEPDIDEVLSDGIGINEDFTLEYDFELVTAGMTMGWNEIRGSGLGFFTIGGPGTCWIGVGIPYHQTGMGVFYGDGWDERVLLSGTSGHVVVQRVGGVVHVYLNGNEVDTFTCDTEIMEVKACPDDTDSEYDFYLRNIKLYRGIVE